jgi:hypothetical protein
LVAGVKKKKDFDVSRNVVVKENVLVNFIFIIFCTFLLVHKLAKDLNRETDCLADAKSAKNDQNGNKGHFWAFVFGRASICFFFHRKSPIRI